MESNHTPGNWSVGKLGGTVITDIIPSDYKPGSGHDATDYYGGFLIAESLHRRDQNLIAAAPELLEALDAVFEHAKLIINSSHADFKKAVAALNKANGVQVSDTTKMP